MTPSSTPSDPLNPDSVQAQAAAAASASPADASAQALWEKSRGAVITVCVAVVLAILVKGGWDYFATQRLAGLQKEFQACTTPESLKAFAADHPDSALGGVAALQAADDAYSAGNMADAADGYRKAVGMLPSPFSVRARLGLGMAEVQSGSRADGEDILRQISIDTALIKSFRAQATYQLASLAADEGKWDEVERLSDSLMQLDPQSLWTQRAYELRSRMSAGAASSASLPTAPAGAAPAITLPSAH